ncbi:MAG: hypothetical protein JO041_01555, partial [Acidobacteria bacterium]|nr:hypothetical protein [Acidobacteriota bacterium]
INTLSATGLYAKSPEGNLAEQRSFNEGSATVRYPQYGQAELSSRLAAENTAMIELAESTGGRFFRNSNDLSGGFKDLADSGLAYILTFAPDHLKHDGKFHKLTVKVRSAGRMTVQARNGYFAPSQREPSLAAEKEPPSAPAVAETAHPEPPATLPSPGAAQPAGASGSAALQPQPAVPALPEQPPASPPKAPQEPAMPAPPAPGERQFIQRASHEVDRYLSTFVDLTSDETRDMEAFAPSGQPLEKKTIRSALVVYRLHTNPVYIAEYRDVLVVDGVDIRDHTERSARMWKEIAKAHSAAEELQLVRADSERFDVGLSETGFTLSGGLPLSSICAGDFDIHEVRRETVDGRPARVFAYTQVRPCGWIVYNFPLPARFRTSPLTHSGELAIDAESAELIGEERDVFIGPKIRVAHMSFDYVPSPFGIRVPRRIVVEAFVAEEDFKLQVLRFPLRARIAQSYGPFRRFEVNVQEKAKSPPN